MCVFACESRACLREAHTTMGAREPARVVGKRQEIAKRPRVFICSFVRAHCSESREREMTTEGFRGRGIRGGRFGFARAEVFVVAGDFRRLIYHGVFVEFR